MYTCVQLQLVTHKQAIEWKQYYKLSTFTRLHLPVLCQFVNSVLVATVGLQRYYRPTRLLVLAQLYWAVSHSRHE